MEIHRPNDHNPSRKYVSQQLQFRNPYFPRTTPKETRKRRAKIYLWLALIVLAGLGYLVAFSGLWRVSNITVTGATPDHERMIRDSLSKYLQQRRALVLPGDNGWWIDSTQVSRYLIDQLKDQASFEEFNVAKPNLKKITITVKERTAKLLWQVSAQEYFLLDGRGVVFSPITISEEQPAPDLPLVKNATKTATTIGSEIITAEQAATIVSSVQQLRQRWPELTINYSTPIVRESVRTVCVDTSETSISNSNSNSNANANINTNRNANTNSSAKNANIRPSNANLNSNVTSNTNTNANLNTEPPCETEEVATGRYAKEALINIAKDTDIYFSADESVDDQINAVGVLLNEKITDINKISYIDVRYLPRAYYK